MNNHYHFIINPTAGRGKTYKAIKDVRKILSNLNIDHKISITKSKGHATKIAKQAISESNIIVAVGGDGTVNEVANGLVSSDSALGVIPLGSGNDFAKVVNMPLNLRESINILLKNQIKTIDVGKIITSINHSCKSNIYDDRYFINTVGIGFDAVVANESAKIKYVRGLPLYITALIRALLKYKTPNFSVNIDGKLYEEKFFLITIGNGTCSGGGFYLTPDAILDDGIFDICYVNDLNIFKILKIFPSVLKGSHGKFSEVNFLKTTNLMIDSKEMFYVHADGEIVGNNVNRAKIKMLQAGIKVVHG